MSFRKRVEISPFVNSSAKKVLYINMRSSLERKHQSKAGNAFEPDSEELYKRVYGFLYEYRFGQITFLEALDKIEEVLSIKHGQPKHSHPPKAVE